MLARRKRLDPVKGGTVPDFKAHPDIGPKLNLDEANFGSNLKRAQKASPRLRLLLLSIWFTIKRRLLLYTDAQESALLLVIKFHDHHLGEYMYAQDHAATFALPNESIRIRPCWEGEGRGKRTLVAGLNEFITTFSV